MILSKYTPPHKLYVWIVILCSIAMITYTFPEELDITDYYRTARIEASSSITLGKYFLFVVINYVDFIYHTLLFISVRAGIPLNLITIFFLSLYYILMIEVVRRVFNNISIRNEVLLFSLLSCSFIWVQEVSRTVTAIVFIYFAFIQFEKKKKIKALLFLILSFFTHVFAAFFIFCFLIGYLLKKLDISKSAQLVSLLSVFLIALLAPDQIVNYAMEKISGLESHYSSYSIVEFQSIFSYSSIGYGDRLCAIMTYVYSLFLVIASDKKHTMYWILFVLCVANTFFLVTNYSTFMRVCILLPLFIMYNAVDIITSNNAKTKSILSYLSYIGLLVFVIEMYSYRNIYSIF